jgi:hypothetical protein
MAVNYSKPIIVRDSRNGSWFWIHTHVWKDKRLGKSDKLVYGTLSAYASTKQTAFPSITTISEDASLSLRQAHYSLKKLEKLRYIGIERIRGKANTYTLLKTMPTSATIAPVQNMHQGSAKSTLGTSAKSTLRTRTNITRTNNKSRYDNISSITEDDIYDIAQFYGVPSQFVFSKLDDLRNYCESKGRTYEDYKATLRNWVKQDAEELRKEASGKSKIRLISPDPSWENPR